MYVPVARSFLDTHTHTYIHTHIGGEKTRNNETKNVHGRDAERVAGLTWKVRAVQLPLRANIQLGPIASNTLHTAIRTCRLGRGVPDTMTSRTTDWPTLEWNDLDCDTNLGGESAKRTAAGTTYTQSASMQRNSH